MWACPQRGHPCTPLPASVSGTRCPKVPGCPGLALNADPRPELSPPLWEGNFKGPQSSWLTTLTAQSRPRPKEQAAVLPSGRRACLGGPRRAGGKQDIWTPSKRPGGLGKVPPLAT